MSDLSKLTNSHRPRKKAYRVGRGMGSKCGKTCGRGVKGDKARRGYKHHYGQEGGQIPLYKKLPTKGFSNGRFKNQNFIINLGRLDQFYKDSEEVTLQTLREKGLAPRRVLGGLKILSQGELKKKVTVKAHFFSEKAKEKLQKRGISFEVLAAGA